MSLDSIVPHNMSRKQVITYLLQNVIPETVISEAGLLF